MTAVAVGLTAVLAFVFAMLGLGGALLYIPVFSWLGYDFKTVAVPAGLLLNAVTAISAAAYYRRAGMVDVRGALPLVATSFLAAPVGAAASRLVPTRALIGLFAMGMVLAGARMIRSASEQEPQALMEERRRWLLTGSAGLGIGFVAGLLGIGGGFLIVPMLIVVGYPTKGAAATSSFAVIFSSLSGFAGHVAQGHFDPVFMTAAAAAALLGSQLGAHTMRERVKPEWLKRGFGILLLAVSARLAWQVLS